MRVPAPASVPTTEALDEARGTVVERRGRLRTTVEIEAPYGERVR